MLRVGGSPSSTYSLAEMAYAYRTHEICFQLLIIDSAVCIARAQLVLDHMFISNNSIKKAVFYLNINCFLQNVLQAWHLDQKLD